MKKTVESPGFIKGMGRFDATNIVIGSMIGSGIFIAPSLMAGYIQTPGLLILLWMIGGILTIFGALSIGELASAFPKAGGQYVFLKEAYSPLLGFLYGWTLFLVIQSGFIAAVAIAFAKYLGVFFPLLGEQNVIFSWNVMSHPLTFSIGGLTLFKMGPIVLSFNTAQMSSIVCISLLTGINMRGVRAGAWVQNVFTVAKMGALFLLMGSAFLLGSGSLKNWFPLLKPVLPAAATLPFLAAMAVAMSKALFAYDAWTSVTFVAEEVREPHRNIPLSLFLGSGAVTILYTLTVLAYMYIIPVAQMARIAENRIGAAVAQSVMGQAGLVFITLAILISTFGCINGLILAGSRLYQAMAADRMFFKNASAIHPRFKTPQVSLFYQGIWASILVLSGTYSDLLTYAAFASLLFNSLTVIGLIKLRIQRPQLERPYRVTGYPIVPLCYILIALFFVIYIIIGDPLNSGKGIFLILSGLPVYYYWKKTNT